MVNLAVELSKYFFVMLASLYVIAAFVALRRRDEDARGGVYALMSFLTVALHTLGMADLCLLRYAEQDMDAARMVLMLYGAQFLLLFLWRLACRVLYAGRSRLLLCEMEVLLSIGFVVLSRLSLSHARRQLVIIAASLAFSLIVPALIHRLRFLKRLTWVYAGVGLAALSIVLFTGRLVNGSKLSYQVMGLTFQPSEIVKLLFAFFIAGLLYRAADHGHMLLSAAAAALHVLIQVASKDLGSALIFFVMYVTMVYVASGKHHYLAAGFVGGALSAVIAYALFSHVRVRVQVWMDPWADPDRKGYQLTQSLFGLATGGWFGMGLGHGSPKTIPYVEEDFVFSAIVEEFGALFGILLILICLCTALTMLQIASRTRDRFYRIVASGLAVCYGVQVALTIGGGTGFIPLTGVTLPLISNGGTSALMTLLLLAIMQGVQLIRMDEAEAAWQDAASDEDARTYDETGARHALDGFDGMDAADDAKLLDEADGYGEADVADVADVADGGEPLDGTGVFGGLGAQDDAWATGEASAPDKADVAPLRERQNRCIFVCGLLYTLLYLAMAGNIVHFLCTRGDAAIVNPYNGKLLAILKEDTVRGTIYAADDTALAYTEVAEDGIRARVYPYGAVYAHVVGYASNGGLGVEAMEEKYLITSDAGLSTKARNDLAGATDAGNNVYTTLLPAVQQAAYDALGSYQGAIVVTRVGTGEVLAMVSKPDFQPSEIDEIWDGLLADAEDSTLVNRATQGLYPPGSTFKILTLLQYLREHDLEDDDYRFECGGSYTLDGASISCYHGIAHGSLDLRESFAKSCNSSFASLGATLDRQEFAHSLLQMGFNAALPVDFPSNASRVRMREEMATYDVLQTLIGQSETLMTPLHLNMITAAIANGGVMMKPYVVDSVVSPDERVLRRNTPEDIARVMTEEECALMTEYMRLVVTEGTATRIADRAYAVAGKTGSAEFSSDKSSHAWFTGFAPADAPEVAITVIVEDAGSGGAVSAPIAGQVLDAFFADYDFD